MLRSDPAPQNVPWAVTRQNVAGRAGAMPLQPGAKVSNLPGPHCLRRKNCTALVNGTVTEIEAPLVLAGRTRSAQPEGWLKSAFC